MWTFVPTFGPELQRVCAALGARASPHPSPHKEMSSTRVIFGGSRSAGPGVQGTLPPLSTTSRSCEARPARLHADLGPVVWSDLQRDRHSARSPRPPRRNCVSSGAGASRSSWSTMFADGTGQLPMSSLDYPESRFPSTAKNGLDSVFGCSHRPGSRCDALSRWTRISRTTAPSGLCSARRRDLCSARVTARRQTPGWPQAPAPEPRRSLYRAGSPLRSAT